MSALGKSYKYELKYTIKELMIVDGKSQGHPWGSVKRAEIARIAENGD